MMDYIYRDGRLLTCPRKYLVPRLYPARPRIISRKTGIKLLAAAIYRCTFGG